MMSEESGATAELLIAYNIGKSLREVYLSFSSNAWLTNRDKALRAANTAYSKLNQHCRDLGVFIHPEIPKTVISSSEKSLFEFINNVLEQISSDLKSRFHFVTFRAFSLGFLARLVQHLGPASKESLDTIALMERHCRSMGISSEEFRTFVGLLDPKKALELDPLEALIGSSVQDSSAKTEKTSIPAQAYPPRDDDLQRSLNRMNESLQILFNRRSELDKSLKEARSGIRIVELLVFSSIVASLSFVAFFIWLRDVVVSISILLVIFFGIPSLYHAVEYLRSR